MSGREERFTERIFESIRNNADSLSATEVEVDEELSGKQDTLVSGVNIKTINSTSLLGSGDLVISGGGGDFHIDGGNASSIYTADQVIDGGGA